MTASPFGSAPTSFGVHVAGAGESFDCALTLADVDVTVTEVLAALALPSQTVIDGRQITAPDEVRAIDALGPGSMLVPPGAAADPLGAAADAIEDALVEVAVVAGLDAGSIVQVGAGLHRIGRCLEDPASGWFLEVDRSDATTEKPRPWHESATSHEAVVGAEAAVALVSPIDPEPGYVRTVHRPPRALPPDSVTPIELATSPPPVRPPAALSWATMLAPIPIALLMAVFFRPIFAVFAAMGPVMALGRWYESRRRFRKDTASRERAVAALEASFESDLARQAESVAQLRWLSAPHVAELWRRARRNSVRLWERRPQTPGYLALTAGVGPDVAEPSTTGDHDGEIHGAGRRSVEIRSVPHLVDLASNAGVGVHGDRAAALAVTRSLVLQLASLHGPADVAIGIVCTPESRRDWDWIKWLPHTDRSLVAANARPVGRALMRSRAPITVVVVDDTSADVAAILRDADDAEREVRIIAIAPNPTMVPAACSTLIGLENTQAELASPELTGRRRHVCPTGISMSTASAWARSLAALRDPEAVDLGTGSNEAVRLQRLVGLETSEAVAARWAIRSDDAGLGATIGVCDEGPFSIDLVDDGPHALVAGTTGSGKSEFLRTLVVGLAVECPPDRLNFVLIDFKGGGAFDAVARLPHVAGLITDLDEALVGRAVSSLRAELQRREALFRDLSVSDYVEATRTSPGPIARLVVIIDEFAALATNHPELMASIIDLATRGRSLGMHLVLATQRPSGVVDQKIRANTNLRVALRVQDAFDSQDLIGTADAAHIDRTAPGRAIFSVGGDTPVVVQTAFTGAADIRAARCSIGPHVLFSDPATAFDRDTALTDTALTELDALVESIVGASAGVGEAARALWSEPLPDHLDWIDLGTRDLEVDGPMADSVALGLVDVPERQTQVAWRWEPASGPLAIYGASAPCAANALLSLGAALATSTSPELCHVYVIDGDAGRLASLEHLPHTGAYVTLAEFDRVERTVRLFESTLAARRRVPAGAGDPKMVLLIDNLAAVLSMVDDLAAASLIDRLGGLARDGARQGVHLVVTARTVRDIGHRLGQQIPNRLVLALADPGGYLTLGLKARDVVPLPPMRAIDVASGRVLQLVEPPEMASLSTDHGDQPDRLPIPVRGFPASVDRSDLGPAHLGNDGTIDIPIGIEAEHLGEAMISLGPGEHALIVARSGRGRSSALELVARQVADAGLDIVRIAPDGSPLASPALPGVRAQEPDAIAGLVGRPVGGDPVIVVVDDGHRLPTDLGSALEQLAASPGTVRVVAGVTPDFARGVRSWTNQIRHGGIGVILGGARADGDIFGVNLHPIDGIDAIAGRGHVVARGRVQSAQIALANAAV